jgi:anaerobic ribonucleoside-triphosphate reductase activating protein
MTLACTKALGPYSRFAIWVQGCLKRCPGCISKDSQPLDGGYEAETTTLGETIISTPDIEGITISGGEPFLQSEALVDLVNRVKLKMNVGVIVYTGNNFEEIENDELTKLCDVIIDGEYIENLNDGLSLRGSSNQNIHLITKRYENAVKNLYGAQGRKTELHLREDETILVGIPDKQNLLIWRNKLKKIGE